MSLSFKELKPKQRELRSNFSEPVGLRIHRCLSWLGRSEQTGDDYDASFIFLWISFNAAYAEKILDDVTNGQRVYFEDYFKNLINLDNDNRIYDVVWDQFPQSIRVFLNNKFVFQPFWKHQNNTEGYDDWEERFEASKRRFNLALMHEDTKVVLSMLFDRLYVLRNQIIHGGATWNSSVNRDQVKDGSRILRALVPVFVDIMMENHNSNWGSPYYPVVK